MVQRAAFAVAGAAFGVAVELGEHEDGQRELFGERGTNGHCDDFWGLALALHAAKNPGWTFAPVAVARGGEAFERRTERGVYGW